MFSERAFILSGYILHLAVPVSLRTSSHIAAGSSLTLVRRVELYLTIIFRILSEMAEACSTLSALIKELFFLRSCFTSGVMKGGSQLLIVHFLRGKNLSKVQLIIE